MKLLTLLFSFEYLFLPLLDWGVSQLRVKIHTKKATKKLVLILVGFLTLLYSLGELVVAVYFTDSLTLLRYISTPNTFNTRSLSKHHLKCLNFWKELTRF
jgi:hypothetical protein